MDTLTAFSARLTTAEEAQECAHVAFPEVTDNSDAVQVVEAISNEMARTYWTGVMLGHLPHLDEETLQVVASHVEHAIIVAMAYGMLASAAISTEIPDDPSGLE